MCFFKQELELAEVDERVGAVWRKILQNWILCLYIIWNMMWGSLFDRYVCWLIHWKTVRVWWKKCTQVVIHFVFWCSVIFSKWEIGFLDEILRFCWKLKTSLIGKKRSNLSWEKWFIVRYWLYNLLKSSFGPTIEGKEKNL